jgi:NADH:ubiquinone oxidoreductase subunit 3 (subunit A)
LACGTRVKNRFLRVIIVLVLFELGILLVFLPWSTQYWDHNFFLGRYPELIRYLLYPAVRGLISGLGILDIIVAINLLRRAPTPSAE